MTERHRKRTPHQGKAPKRRTSASVTSDPLGLVKDVDSWNEWVSIRRRYTRSINLERDLSMPGSVQGYVVTPRAADALGRLRESVGERSGNRAFTLTGTYGVGKSAFAHFFSALLSGAGNPLRAEALALLSHQLKNSTIARSLEGSLPQRGLVRAVATARRESTTSVVTRALARGAKEFFGRGRPPTVLREILLLASRAESGRAVEPSEVLAATSALADASRSGVVLIIDELGKVFEHAAASSAADDVYLLQQLAEMPESAKGYPILLLGLLHQTFTEYGYSLALAQRTEWQKVQGRFEDIVYSDAPENMLSLVASAISHDCASNVGRSLFASLGDSWHAYLKAELDDPFVARALSPNTITAVAPLHPLAALILPQLCAKYAQHDRSLFAFLSSNETHSFGRFLFENAPNNGRYPLYRISGLYDYFIDVAGSVLAFRPQFQRWAEIHGVVSDARALDPDLRDALKTIATLNLIATSGPYRASRSLVLAALVGSPTSDEERVRWSTALSGLQARGLVSYRSVLDEYRIWEGSEFDTDGAVRDRIRVESRPLATLLTEHARMSPTVAQRHSFDTGTLRYFERAYAGDAETVSAPNCASALSDGLILYWVGQGRPPSPAPTTVDGRPVVLIVPDNVQALRTRAEELAALKQVLRSPQLQSDGVARRDVSVRITFAQNELEKAIRDAFEPGQATLLVSGSEERVGYAALNSYLSDLCDRVYPEGIKLLNELINRRELTSAGARARREVIEAMISQGQLPKLGIQGNGPEASLYESVLARTGIHVENGGQWGFGPPTEGGIRPLWHAIENFCLESREIARGVDELLLKLDRPPYGIKRGVVPIVLAAVWLYHIDDVSVYFEGRFVPALGPEHFELLVKHPERFSVKHIELSGLRWELLRQLEELILHSGEKRKPLAGARNATLLTVLRPLVRFVQRLPAFTQKTAKLSPEAIAVRDALLEVREPDDLLFRALPSACGMAPFTTEREVTNAEVTLFRRRLSEVLKELDTAYERLLQHCQALMHTAFAAAGSDHSRLRQDLRVRAEYLVGRVIDPTLRAVVLASVNDATTDREWLEALVTVIQERPADVWTDEDTFAFEFRVTNVARRMANLWALVHEAAASGRDRFDARRLTITHSDGREAHKLVWFDHSVRDLIDQVTRDLLGKVQSFPREQQFAVAASIAEAVFEGEPASGAASTVRALNQGVEPAVGHRRALGINPKQPKRSGPK